jgi:hypothetical protein
MHDYVLLAIARLRASAMCVSTPTMTMMNVLLTPRSWCETDAACGTSEERAEGSSLEIHDFLNVHLWLVRRLH